MQILLYVTIRPAGIKESSRMSVSVLGDSQEALGQGSADGGFFRWLGDLTVSGTPEMDSTAYAQVLFQVTLSSVWKHLFLTVMPVFAWKRGNFRKPNSRKRVRS